MWSKNNELFYETADKRIMVVEYSVDGDSFIVGKRRLWSDRRLIYDAAMNVALHPDGKRFAVFESPKAAESDRNTVHVTFLLNFFDCHTTAAARLSCALGMLSSLEVKVLRPT